MPLFSVKNEQRSGNDGMERADEVELKRSPVPSAFAATPPVTEPRHAEHQRGEPNAAVPE